MKRIDFIKTAIAFAIPIFFVFYMTLIDEDQTISKDNAILVMLMQLMTFPFVVLDFRQETKYVICVLGKLCKLAIKKLNSLLPQ